MPYASLAAPSDLEGFEGAPFDARRVSAACADVRGEARWHIAPQVTETLTLSCYGGQFLTLPTRRLVSVTAVRDVTSGSTVLTGWQVIGPDLYMSSVGFPVGTVEVDLTHGYAKTPDDLLPVIADRARGGRTSNVRQRSEAIGGVSSSVTYAGVAVDPVVARYALLPGVA